MPGPELNSQVATEVDDGGLAGRVAVRALLAQRPDPQPRDAGCDENPARILHRSPLLQQRREQLYGVEDGLDVQVHDLLERPVRVRVKLLPPRCARIGEEDVDMVGVRADAREELPDTLNVGRVGRYGDGLCAGGEVG